MRDIAVVEAHSLSSVLLLISSTSSQARRSLLRLDYNLYVYVSIFSFLTFQKTMGFSAFTFRCFSGTSASWQNLTKSDSRLILVDKRMSFHL